MRFSIVKGKRGSIGSLPALRHMSYSQGKVVAGLWQGIARIFTVNLKAGYDPEHNEYDAMIERIILRIQNGTL